MDRFFLIKKEKLKVDTSASNTASANTSISNKLKTIFQYNEENP